MEKKNKTLEDAVIDFINKHTDADLADEMFNAAMNVAFDEDGKGDTEKAFCGFAWCSALFVKMCANAATSEGRKFTAEEYGSCFKMCLDAFCALLDAEDEEGQEASR